MASMFDDDYFITPLSRYSYIFPDASKASDEGLLAYGGDLSVPRLLTAYRSGIFPWFNEDDPILWWSPNPRLLLFPKDFKVRKSFRKVLKSNKFVVKFDERFEDVIRYCSSVPRDGQDGTWILPDIVEAYTALHKEGFAHSVEVYLDDRLVGGLYGVAIGGMFCGESMFSLVSDASKVAFKALSDVLGGCGYDFIDCQLKTEHLVSLGAVEVDRDEFLYRLDKAINKQNLNCNWQDFRWSYKD
jgi:leucyl/phenylalanyl-tRNA--protein transferase